jgi:hypothetical protein
MSKSNAGGVLLLDLGVVSKDGKVDNANLFSIARLAIACGWKIVAASSSGGGSRIDSDDSEGFSLYTSTFNSCISIISKSFTEKEAVRYMQEYSIDSSWKDQIYQYTGWNPGLMASFKYPTSNENRCFNTCAARCVKNVTRLGELILESAADKDKHFFMSLQNCEEFLSGMSYNELIPISKLRDYNDTYLGEENLAHVTFSSVESIEYFSLELNYPTLYNVLCSKICSIAKVNKFYYDNPTVQGYVFEAVFLQTCKTLEVEAREIKEGQLVDERTKKKFTIKHFQACDVIPTKLRDSCLYELPKGHPAIDAVGIFEYGGEKFLVMIQVSISTYSTHDSKFQDIYGNLKGQTNKSIQQYYFNLADNIHHCVYLYLSGKEVCSESDVLTPTLSSLKLRSGKELNKRVNCFVGIAERDSITHEAIKKALKFIDDAKR